MEKPILQLVVEKGPKKGETLDCHPGSLIRVGRVVRGNTFAIRDPGISQKHLTFEFLPAAACWAVTDLATSNGTLVNGRTIHPSAPFNLVDGDSIKIGETTCIAVKIGGERDLPGKEEEGSGLPRRGRRRGAQPPPPPPPQPLDLVAEEDNSEAPAKIGGRGRRALKKPAPLARVSKKDEISETVVAEEIVEDEENIEAPARNGGEGRRESEKPATSGRISKKDELLDAIVVEDSTEEESREEIARNGRSARAASKKAAPSARDSEKDESLDAAVVEESVQEDDAEAPARNVGRGRGRRRKAAASTGFSEKNEILDTVAVEDGTQEPKNEVRRRGRGRRIATRASSRCSKEEDVVELEPSAPVPVVESEATEAAEKGNSMVEGDADDGIKAQENGDEEVRAEEGLDDMEKMTLGEWFDRMEKVLPVMINDMSEEIISSLREKARLFDEFIATSANAN